MKSEQIALILIDIQTDFWPPLSKHQEFKTFPDNITNMLKKSRDRGLTVIHVRSVFKADRSDWMLFYRPEGRGEIPCIEGTGGIEIEDFAAPVKGETVVEKQTFDALVNTELVGILKEKRVKAALVVGMETSVCVLFTATSLYLRDIVPLVVSDACADEPGRHETTLNMYKDLCFKTVTTKEVNDNWLSVIKIVEQFKSGKNESG